MNSRRNDHKSVVWRIKSFKYRFLRNVEFTIAPLSFTHSYTTGLFFVVSSGSVGVLLPTVLEVSRSCSAMEFSYCDYLGLIQDCTKLCETDNCNGWKVPPSANSSLWGFGDE